MTISTKDCKDFISHISSIIGVSANDTWKRTKKYNQNNLVLRDFESNHGTTLTICEYNGVLTLYSLTSSSYIANNKHEADVEIIQEFIEPGFKYMGTEIDAHDVTIFLSECATLHPFIADLDAQESAKDPKNWSIINVTSPHPNSSYELEYKDDEDFPCELDQKDVSKVYWFLLGPDYDTRYRYLVFETKGQYLCLGTNEPD